MPRPRTLIWLLLAGPAMMACLSASLLVAAMILPPIFAMQAAFAVPVFLIAGSAVGAALMRRAGARIGIWWIALALAVILAVVASSVIYGMTTPGETLIVGIVLYTLAFIALWRVSPREA